MISFGKCTNDLFRHFVYVLGDLEIVNAPLRLGAVIGINWHFYFAHCIFFYAVLHKMKLELARQSYGKAVLKRLIFIGLNQG
jgi:hypothetical protein